MQNTNVNGKQKVAFALRIIKGIGRRFANLTCKIAQIDLNRRAGELSEAEMEKINDIITKPIGK
jgi:small subunit ribosomal protein S18e